jgi:hypothetical protein
MLRVRHLDMNELLALRDGEGAAFARGHVETCEPCRRELERLHGVRAELRALPTFVPPRELWSKVAADVKRRRVRNRFALGTFGLAAAAVLAGFIVMRGPAASPPAEAHDVWVAESTSRDLGPFISRSRQLETMLRVYSPTPRVYDARTALAVSVLEDRIVLLDRALEESHAIGVDRRLLVGLWDERVETLETLVGLRLAEQPERVWR